MRPSVRSLLVLGILALPPNYAHAGRCDGTKPSVQWQTLSQGPGEHVLRILWTYQGPSDCKDYYNFRWGIAGGEESQVDEAGRECPQYPQYGPPLYCARDVPVQPNAGYVFKVQACNRRLLQTSQCSQWGQTCYGPSVMSTCKAGFVWREAFADDHVCVTPQDREQAASDNSQAAARTAEGGAPDTCRSGYVWREAVPDDHVCVTPPTRDQAAQDNREAEARREAPRGRLDSIYTCRQGYVPRLSRPHDLVCVTPQTRAQVLSDNRQAADRRGSEACRTGHVWREASPQDRVCVTPETRSKVQQDNAHANERLACAPSR